MVCCIICMFFYKICILLRLQKILLDYFMIWGFMQTTGDIGDLGNRLKDTPMIFLEFFIYCFL